jgi:hypothetical protein
VTTDARKLLGALTASLVLAAIAASPATAQPTAAPAEFYGANIQALIRQGFAKPATWPSFLRAGSQAGLTIARFDAAWGWAEPKAPGPDGVHRYDWGRLDQVAGSLAAQGLRWLPVVDLPPAWATTAGNGLPDARQADFAAFAGAFAARYGSGGTFWSAHPELPTIPVEHAEVWTEANSSHFWVANPDAAGYLHVFTQVRAAMKAADPNIGVLISLGWQDVDAFANQLYDAGLSGQSDGVAFHPYAPTARGAVVLTSRLRNTLTARGEPDLPIYITEIGWPKAPGGAGAERAYDGPVSDASRAGTAALAADALAASDCNVKSYILYSLVEEQKDPAKLEDWLGLINPDGSPTLTLQALAGSTARWSAIGARARAASLPDLLPLCHGPATAQATVSDTMPPNGQLPLQLSFPPPSSPCTAFQVRYYDQPLEDVTVFVRTYRGSQAGATTHASGQAQLCMSAVSRRKPFLVWARSGGMAASTVQSCRGNRCAPLSCRSASLVVRPTRLGPYRMRLALSVKCGRHLLLGAPVKVNGINLEGRPRKLKALRTGVRTDTIVVAWDRKHPLRAVKVRYAGDRSFMLGPRVKSIPMGAPPSSPKPAVP